ncbi:MAG: (2S)-methylsuccinyl-CoA dehydrogenase [Alphaproteobacteria bacterium]|nr:MAG: (2S)-methylsuccinyl-CoA dehydrogenase [Alphaproteobacteria bacterium]
MTLAAVAADSLVSRLEQAASAVETYVAAARGAVAAKVVKAGKVDRRAFDAEQHAAHGFAWIATYGEALREVASWARALDAAGGFGETEQLLALTVFSEYCAQLVGGLPMTQLEMIRPGDLGIEAEARTLEAATRALVREGAARETRARLAELVRAGKGKATLERTGLEGDLEMIRDQFRRFADDRVMPHAHGWHLRDEFIPMEIVEEMGALGVFGLTIPEEFGGSGMGKAAMCVVSEELSRAWIGVGSLATRSEIAAELILIGGTDEQKNFWLPKIATAEILPTAVFTEPNTGSDLGSLRTRAALDGDQYVVTGTHKGRHDGLRRPVDAAGAEAARR